MPGSAVRQASLPDLLRGRAKPSMANMAEGFAGARPSSAIASTRKSLPLARPARPTSAQLAPSASASALTAARGGAPPRPMSAVLQRRARPTSASAAKLAGLADAGAYPSASSTNPAIVEAAAAAAEAADAAAATLSVSLISYLRQRQQLLEMENTGRRPPRQLENEVRSMDQTLAEEVRALNPLFFQRFDNTQLERMLRAMPILKVPQGRWLYGDDTLDAQWPPSAAQRAFLLLAGGPVGLHADSGGGGQREICPPGTIFGDGEFWLGDESVQERSGRAAIADQLSFVGVLTTQVLQTAFADRSFGNGRIMQTAVRRVPTFVRLSNPEAPLRDTDIGAPETALASGVGGGGRGAAARSFSAGSRRGGSGSRPPSALGKQPESEEKAASATVMLGLKELSSFTTNVRIEQGEELLIGEAPEESLLVVAAGAIEVRADVHFVERFDNLPPEKAVLKVFIENAEGLAGESVVDKLDPYLVVKFGEAKKFQTPVLWNAGTNPKIKYEGAFTFEDEDELEFLVLDRSAASSFDTLCGSGVLDISQIGNEGWRGKVNLSRPKKSPFRSETLEEVPAGHLSIVLTWELMPGQPPRRPPKEKTFFNETLFILKDHACWGHEALALGAVGKAPAKTLSAALMRSATDGLAYGATISRLRLVAIAQGRNAAANETAVCWKLSTSRFSEFLKRCGRETPFLQECRMSLMRRQLHVKQCCLSLLKRWETEERDAQCRGKPDMTPEEPPITPRVFRAMFQGSTVRITMKNGVNLPSGSWFSGKLDPFAMAKFKGGRGDLRTSVLQDTTSDPVWNCEGSLIYHGEQALSIRIYDYDKNSEFDEVIAEGDLPLASLCASGGGSSVGRFEGLVNLEVPANASWRRRKRALGKQMGIVLSVAFELPGQQRSQRPPLPGAPPIASAAKALRGGGPGPGPGASGGGRGVVGFVSGGATPVSERSLDPFPGAALGASGSRSTFSRAEASYTHGYGQQSYQGGQQYHGGA